MTGELSLKLMLEQIYLVAQGDDIPNGGDGYENLKIISDLALDALDIVTGWCAPSQKLEEHA